VRLVAFALVLGLLGAPRDDARVFGDDVRREGPRLAALGDSVPGLFVRLVNAQIRGRIDPRAVRFVAPAGVVLEDAVLSDPNGAPVARVKEASAKLSLRSLLAGEIVISHITLEAPQLILTLQPASDGAPGERSLNLIEALKPKKPPDPNKEASGQVRIEEVRALGGGFRFTDGENVTVTADGINASAAIDVDLGQERVRVDVRDLSVAAAALRLPDLDVPIARVAAARLIVTSDHGAAVLDVPAAAARAAGAAVRLGGTVALKEPGRLALQGSIDAPAGAWPERLAPLPFDAPAFRATVKVSGPFADPAIAADATFARAEAYGYAVDGGRAVLAITKARVALLEGTQVTRDGGSVRATGGFGIEDRRLDLAVRAQGVPLAVALAPAGLEPRPGGTVGGSVAVTGVADGKSPITIAGSVQGHRVAVAGAHPAGPRGDVRGDVKVVVQPEGADGGPGSVRVERASFSGDGLEASVDGVVRLPAGESDARRGEGQDGSLDLRVKARVEDAEGLHDALPPELAVRDAAFDGAVHGPLRHVRVEGRATARAGDAWGVPLADVEAQIVASAEGVRVPSARAVAAGGAVSLAEPLTIDLGQARGAGKALAGRVTVKGAMLAQLRTADGEPLPVAGTADGEAVLAGTVDAPEVRVRASAGGLAVAGENLERVTARAVVTQERLVVVDAAVDAPLITARTRDLSLAFDTLAIAGVVDVERLQLASLSAARAAALRGVAAGSVVVTGTVRAPDVRGRFAASGVAVGPQAFGDGPVSLAVHPDDAAPPKTAGRVVTAAAVLAARAGQPGGSYDVHAAYALERRTLNVRALLTDIDLAALAEHARGAVAPFDGQASGLVELQGPLDALSGRVRLRVPELAVVPAGSAHPAATSQAADRNDDAQALPPRRPLGAVRVDVILDHGDVSGRVCAFPGAFPGEPGAALPPPTVPADVRGQGSGGGGDALNPDDPCGRGERVWANLSGSVALSRGAFDVAIDGAVAERALEDLVPALAAQNVEAGLAARIAAQVTRTPAAPRGGRAGPPEGEAKEAAALDVRAHAILLQADVQAPQAPRASLVGQAELGYQGGRVSLAQPARFRTAQGDVDIVIAGSAGTEDIALDVSGPIALAIVKVLTTEVANAAGTAQTALSVRGRYDEGVTVEGTITPATDAEITPRALGQPIVFRRGALRIAPVGAARDHLLRVTAEDLRARLGDGEVQIDGGVDVRTARGADQSLVARWDLAASGTAIEVRRGPAFAEGSFDLALRGDAEPVLRGRVEIVDGQYRRQFELRNFVLSPALATRSEPLWATLAPLGLANLALDVDVTMQNFRTRAALTSFSADLSLRARLHARRTLRLPQIDGAIEAEEGTIDFPRARFEVQEMQIELPTAPDGRLTPVVHLTARAEIPPGGAGGNDTEIPVDLALDGSLEQGLNLDFTALDAGNAWSRSDLLGFVLFGRSLTSTFADGDAAQAGAVRALVGEAFAPATAEAEAFLATHLGVNVELDPTAWRWQVGRRLQLEGATFLLDEEQSAAGPTYGTTTTASSTTSITGGAAALAASSTGVGTDSFRARLLLWDRLAVGKSLSLEGRSGVGGSEFRMTLRWFEN
jgi:hypothetical protein